jgi:predicted PurR-regulated permease PerM
MDTHSGSGTHRSVFWLKYERYPYLLAKLAFFVAIAYGAYAVLHAIQDVLTPLLVSLLLAYLLDPLVDRFEARGHSRVNGILLLLILWFGGVTAFALFLWPTIAHLLDEATHGVPQIFDRIQHEAVPWVDTTVLPWLEQVSGVDLPDSITVIVPELGGSLQNQLPGLLRRVSDGFGALWVRSGAIVASVLNLVLIPVLTFYFLRDFDVMRLSAAEYLPVHNRGWLIDRISQMDVVIGAWIRGQVEVALILAVLNAIGLGFTFGVSGIGVISGVAIGLLAGVLNIIPYFGFVVGFGLAMLLALLDWAGWGPVLGVIITFALVQGLEGYVITPRIVGEKVGLSPVVVIVSLLLGGTLLGVTGVLLALPVAGALRVLLPDLVEWYRRSDLYTGKVQSAAGPELPAPPPLPEG